MSKMSRTNRVVQTKVYKYPGGNDIVNLLETIPNMKYIRSSLIIKGISCDYAELLEWVDANLYGTLSSTLALTEAETEPERKILCKAIRYYQVEPWSRAKY